MKQLRVAITLRGKNGNNTDKYRHEEETILLPCDESEHAFSLRGNSQPLHIQACSKGSNHLKILVPAEEQVIVFETDNLLRERQNLLLTARDKKTGEVVLTPLVVVATVK